MHGRRTACRTGKKQIVARGYGAMKVVFLLPFSFLLTLSLCPMSGGVEVKLISSEYELRHGYLFIFSRAVSAGTLRLPSGEQLALSAGESRAEAVRIADGRSAGVRVQQAGVYEVMLSNLGVVRRRDGKSVSVPQLVLEDVTVSEEDLRRGSADIMLPHLGLICARAVDENGQAAPNREIGFYSHEGRYSFQLLSDAKGEVYALGNAGDYSIDLIPGPEPSVRLEIRID